MAKKLDWKVSDQELILAFHPSHPGYARNFKVVWRYLRSHDYGQKYFGAENLPQARFFAHEYLVRMEPLASKRDVWITEV